MATAKDARETTAAPEQPLKVFVSYSRADLTFADGVVAGLRFDGGFDVTIDRDSIHEAERWRERLGALIAEADTVVFLLTPLSAASPICRWEVDEAERLSKRIVPVRAASLEGVEPPPQLARLNYVLFEDNAQVDPQAFFAGMVSLRRALNTDIAWLREHTRLLVRAREWLDVRRAENRLLSGQDIADAKAWLANRPKQAPAPTELFHDFISASEHAEATRLSAERERAETLQRAVSRTRRALAVSVVLLAVASAAGWSAYENQRAATEAAERAAIERDAALVTQSRFLANLAMRRVGQGHADASALLLSLEALPDPTPGSAGRALSGRPWVAEAESSLNAASMALLETKVLLGHGDVVRQAIFAPGGGLIVTASEDHTARLWVEASGAELAERTAVHDGPVLGVALGPDGSRFATVSSDGFVRLWNAERQQLLARWKGGRDPIQCIAFDHSGRRLAAAANGTVWLRDAAGERPAVGLHGHRGSVTSIAFSPDDARIVTASTHASGEVLVRDARDGRVLFALPGHGGPVWSVAYSADGARIATASEDHEAWLWDAVTGARLGKLVGHDRGVLSVAFSPDGARVATASADGSARIWDAESRALLAVLDGHAGSVRSIAFSSNGARVVTASSDGTARIWRLSADLGPSVLETGGDPIPALAFTPGGDRLTLARPDALQSWDVAGEIELGETKAGAFATRAAVFSPNGDRIVTIGPDGSTRLWDAMTRTPIVTPEALEGRVIEGEVLGIGFGGGEALVATAAAGAPDLSNTVTVARLSDGAKIGTLAVEPRAVSTVAFSPDGARVAVGLGHAPPKVWDLTAGTPPIALTGHRGRVLSIAFSPDSARIATASSDDDARLWDAASGASIAVMAGHRRDVRAVAFSPDGERIATASTDGDARLWDAADGREIAMLSGRGAAVESLAFSADGARIALAVQDGSVRIWRTPPRFSDLTNQAKRMAPRCLTPAQRKEFFLPPAPPRWCITGAGKEAETNPTLWSPLWPYHTQTWRDWLTGTDRGEARPPPLE